MQVETKVNMKNQVTGVRKSTDEGELERKNKKRIKLVHNSVENSPDKNVVLGASSSLGSSDHFESGKNTSNASGTPEENSHSMHENGQSFHSYISGSFNNGDRSTYEENLSNGNFNEENLSNGNFNKENLSNGNFNEENLSNGNFNKENLSNGNFNDEILCQSAKEMESITTDTTETQYLPPPTLEIHYNDTYQYASSTLKSADELNNSLTDLKDSSDKDLPCSQKELLSCQNSELQSYPQSSPSKNIGEPILHHLPITAHPPICETITSPSSSLEENVPQPKEELVNRAKKDDIKYLGIYDLETTQLEGHADVVFCVAADDKVVISSSGDTTVKVWNVEEQREVSNFAGHSDAVTALILLNCHQSSVLGEKLHCSEVSSIAITASMDCHIKVWSVSDAKEISSIYTYNSITCMDYLHSDLCVVVGTEGGKLEVWDLCEGKQIESVFAHESSITSLKVHDSYAYSSSVDGAVKVWLFEESELQPLYSRRRRERSLDGADVGPTQWKAVAVSNDILFLGDNTPYLKALNWRLGRLRLLVNQLGSTGECDAVLAEDNILLSTSYDSATDTAAINVWSLPDMTYVGTLTGDVQDIYCLAMFRFENKLRIVSGGHQLMVWDFNLREPSKSSANSSFAFYEIEGLGTEVNENPVKSITHDISVSPQRMKDKEEKQGRCIII